MDEEAKERDGDVIETRRVHVVTEYRIDHDDYPVGAGDVVLVTADEERAKKLARWPYPSIEGRVTYGRFSRRMDSYAVEDLTADDGDDEVDDLWHHHFGSHHVQLPAVVDELPVQNYWLSVVDGELRVETVCAECAYVASRAVRDRAEGESHG